MELSYYERPKDHHYLVIKLTRQKDTNDLAELD